MEAVNLKLDSENRQKKQNNNNNQEMKIGAKEWEWKDVMKQKGKHCVCNKHCNFLYITTNIYQEWHKH